MSANVKWQTLVFRGVADMSANVKWQTWGVLLVALAGFLMFSGGHIDAAARPFKKGSHHGGGGMPPAETAPVPEAPSVKVAKLNAAEAAKIASDETVNLLPVIYNPSTNKWQVLLYRSGQKNGWRLLSGKDSNALKNAISVNVECEISKITDNPSAIFRITGTFGPGQWQGSNFVFSVLLLNSSDSRLFNAKNLSHCVVAQGKSITMVNVLPGSEFVWVDWNNIVASQPNEKLLEQGTPIADFPLAVLRAAQQAVTSVFPSTELPFAVVKLSDAEAAKLNADNVHVVPIVREGSGWSILLCRRSEEEKWQLLSRKLFEDLNNVLIHSGGVARKIVGDTVATFGITDKFKLSPQQQSDFYLSVVPITNYNFVNDGNITKAAKESRVSDSHALNLDCKWVGLDKIAASVPGRKDISVPSHRTYQNDTIIDNAHADALRAALESIKDVLPTWKPVPGNYFTITASIDPLDKKLYVLMHKASNDSGAKWLIFKDEGLSVLRDQFDVLKGGRMIVGFDGQTAVTLPRTDKALVGPANFSVSVGDVGINIFIPQPPVTAQSLAAWVAPRQKEKHNYGADQLKGDYYRLSEDEIRSATNSTTIAKGQYTTNAAIDPRDLAVLKLSWQTIKKAIDPNVLPPVEIVTASINPSDGKLSVLMHKDPGPQNPWRLFDGPALSILRDNFPEIKGGTITGKATDTPAVFISDIPQPQGAVLPASIGINIFVPNPFVRATNIVNWVYHSAVAQQLSPHYMWVGEDVIEGTGVADEIGEERAGQWNEKAKIDPKSLALLKLSWQKIKDAIKNNPNPPAFSPSGTVQPSGGPSTGVPEQQPSNAAVPRRLFFEDVMGDSEETFWSYGPTVRAQFLEFPSDAAHPFFMLKHAKTSPKFGQPTRCLLLTKASRLGASSF